MTITVRIDHLTIQVPAAAPSRQVITMLNAIHERLTIMATQADIDALTAQLDERTATLTTAIAGVQSDLDALKAANPALDVTALTASVAALSGVVDTAVAVDAENPPV